MTKQEQIRIKRKWHTYKRCAQGKPVDCHKCIGCSSKKQVKQSTQEDIGKMLQIIAIIGFMLLLIGGISGGLETDPEEFEQ